MGEPLRADNLRIARMVSNAERERRGYHECEACRRFMKPCYRTLGIVLCVECLRAAEQQRIRQEVRA